MQIAQDFQYGKNAFLTKIGHLHGYWEKWPNLSIFELGVPCERTHCELQKLDLPN